MKDFNLSPSDEELERLRNEAKKARYDAIARFAAETAGASLDLDRDFERASIEHLLH